VIDIGLRRIVAPDGTSITLCQVDSNMPINVWDDEPSQYEQSMGNVYSFARALSLQGKLQLDIAPFIVLLKRCPEGFCFSVIAPNDVEESIYHIKRLQGGKTLSTRTPDGAIGKVSKGSRFEFDMLIGSPVDQFRIETIPSVDDILGASHIIYREEKA
jgi:hypothetical protein